MGYRKIDKELIDRAKSDLLKELPHLFKKCDSDWFADWALSRRHKTRNTKKTKKPDSPNTEQQISEDEAPDTPNLESQPSGAGESSSRSSETRGLFSKTPHVMDMLNLFSVVFFQTVVKLVEGDGGMIRPSLLQR